MKAVLILGLGLMALAGHAQQILSNPNFDTTFNGGLATNWTKAPDSGVTMSCAQESSIVHSGAYSQKITVTGLSGTKQALFQQGFNSKDGHVYSGSVWLRASTSSQVQVLLVLGSQRMVGVHTITVDANWQQVVFNGGWKSGGGCTFVVSFLNNGTYYVDEASLTDVTASYLNAPLVNTNVAIPATFFGIHVNHNNTAANWPPIKEGLMRMWDTGTRWSMLQVSNAADTNFNWKSESSWTWGHMDQWVATITTGSPGCKIIYTMGQTPAWAASAEVYPPSDLNTWSNYVWHVATRYKGTIQYYELWNEVDAPNFYKGTIANLVTLAQLARNVLTNIDSNNKLIGPAVTLGGFDTLEQYLRAGGGQYQDIVTYHDYPTSTPENSLAGIVGLKDIIAQFPQVSSVPLWCTEGNPDTIQTGATSAENQGIASRAYLYLWTQNVQTFCWYCWDMSFVGNLKKPPLQSGGSPSTTPAPGGIAYRTLATWLVGAKMLSRTVDAAGNWFVQIQQPGLLPSYIVWNPSSNAVFNIPPAWNIYQRCDLSNNITSFTGTTITAGVTPVRLIAQAGAPPAITLSPLSLSPGTVGISYLQRFTASGGSAPYTFAVASGSLPPGFALFSNGTLSGTPVTPSNYSFSIKATDTNGLSGTNSYILVTDCPAITVGPATLPPATLGAAYSQTNTVSGGAAPYIFSLGDGTLPPGLALSAAGTLAGTPTNTGDYSFTVAVTDGYGCDDGLDYTLTVMAPLVIRAQPQSRTVPEGGTATVSVVADGFPIVCQWFLNSAAIADETNTSLTVTNFQLANEGGYSVLVSNQLGSVLSDTAGLYLDAPLRLLNPSLDSNGWFAFWMAGPAGTNFVVDTSTDLLNWSSLATNPAPSGVLNFTDTNQNSAAQSSRFYRAWLSP